MPLALLGRCFLLMRVQLQIAMRKIICYFYFEQRCGRRRRRRRALLARTSNWN